MDVWARFDCALKKSYMEIWLSATRRVRIIADTIEWVIVIGMGLLFPFPNISPIIPMKILGIIPISIGFWLHRLSHSIHKQVHQPTGKIQALVTSGIYSKIRHPCYSEIILYYIGALVIVGSLAMLIPIALFTYILYDSAVKEEEALKKKFGDEYEDYLKKVRWRFIPYVF